LLDATIYTRLLSLPKIKTVIVDSALNFPILLLQASSKMETLSLRMVETCFMNTKSLSNQEHGPTAVEPRISLRKLVLFGVDDRNPVPFLTWLASTACIFDFSHLEELEFAPASIGPHRSHAVTPALQEFVDGLPSIVRSLSIKNRMGRVSGSSNYRSEP
jgi:hypothetical protein